MENYLFSIQFIFQTFTLINLFIKKIESIFAGQLKKGFYTSKIEIYRGVEQW